MGGGCALEPHSCQCSVLGALLRPTTEKYRMLYMGEGNWTEHI